MIYSQLQDCHYPSLIQATCYFFYNDANFEVDKIKRYLIHDSLKPSAIYPFQGGVARSRPSK